MVIATSLTRSYLERTIHLDTMQTPPIRHAANRHFSFGEENFARFDLNTGDDVVSDRDAVIVIGTEPGPLDMSHSTADESDNEGKQ